MGLRRAIRAWLTAGRGVLRGIDEHALAEAAAGADPLALFDRWFRDARDAGLYLPETMTVATATPDGAPSARQVLLKGYDERGFVFYTNYESRKGRDLGENPRASLLFPWHPIRRQVRVEGSVVKLSHEDSAAYFHSRPYGSRIGAWASRQSQPITRAELEAREQEFRARYGDQPPRPPHWGGYRVVPEALEFWQGRADRLHDRLLYRRAGASWTIERLAP